MRLRSLAAAAVLLAASTAAVAQHPNNSHLIDYKPVSCIRAGELPLLQMGVSTEGELRAYFRRINTTDWCSVMGTNEGPLSRVVLPKFDNGDEIEYFLVVIQGRRVVSRSQRIYRAVVSSECGAMFARHILKLDLSCEEEQGQRGFRSMVAEAIEAGESVPDDFIVDVPLPGSPDNPNQSQ
jgi:hypothetical protein